MQRFVDNIFSYCDSPLPIGSDEIIKRLQMWLDNPQCGHKKGKKFPIFWSDNHQGESSHMQGFRENYVLRTMICPTAFSIFKAKSSWNGMD